MGFLAPLMLVGIIALAVPIAIHLIGRQRARVVKFAALDFLLATKRRTARKFRPRERLLLAVRAIACAAVAIALAKPYTSCTRKGPQVTRGPQAAVLVIDDSFAAGYLVTRRCRALIVLASDLFDPDDDTLRMLAQLRAQRHDVSVLHILDPHERGFPYDGLIQFEALENAHKLLVNPAAIRRDYLERMDAFLTRARGTLTTAGVDYHLAHTDQPLEQTLLELLVARSRLGPARRAG